MKVIFDYDNKVITLESKVNLGKLVKILTSQIENMDEWELEFKDIGNNLRPIVIKPSEEPSPVVVPSPPEPYRCPPDTTPWNPWYHGVVTELDFNGKISGAYCVEFKEG